jgi:hypothetical protein
VLDLIGYLKFSNSELELRHGELGCESPYGRCTYHAQSRDRRFPQSKIKTGNEMSVLEDQETGVSPDREFKNGERSHRVSRGRDSRIKNDPETATRYSRIGSGIPGSNT